MAVNDTVITGRKYRKMVDAENKIWQVISFFTKSKDVQFDDGTNAEEKMGAIKGITTDVSTVTTTGYAVDATAVKKIKVYVGSDGMLHFTDGSGADTVLNFSKYDDGYKDGYSSGYDAGYSAGYNVYSNLPNITAYQSSGTIGGKMVTAANATDFQKSVGTPVYSHRGLGWGAYSYQDAGSGTHWYRWGCTKCSFSGVMGNDTSGATEAAKKSGDAQHYSTVAYGDIVGYLLV